MATRPAVSDCQNAAAMAALQKHGTLRAAAAATGITRYRMRESLNLAQAETTKALLAGLVESQRQQGELLAKLVGGETPAANAARSPQDEGSQGCGG